MDYMRSGMYTNKITRVLWIYSKLMRGQVLSKNELANDLCTSTSSIQRDLEDIRDFLDEKYVTEGHVSQLIYNRHEKGYCLEDYPRLSFSYDEVFAICKILLESHAFSKEEMMHILNKLIEDYIPWLTGGVINDMLHGERFHYIEPWHHDKFLDKFMPLSQAILESRIIQIEYDKPKESETVEQRLAPLLIRFSERYFYLVGFTENNKDKILENSNDVFPTIYRIDQIQQIEVLNERFRIPYTIRYEEYDYRKRIQHMYGGELQKVRFKFTGISLELVLDQFPTARILSEENGIYLIEAVAFGKGIDMWVRSQGDSITEYTII